MVRDAGYSDVIDALGWEKLAQMHSCLRSTKKISDRGEQTSSLPSSFVTYPSLAWKKVQTSLEEERQKADRALYYQRCLYVYQQWQLREAQIGPTHPVQGPPIPKAMDILCDPQMDALICQIGYAEENFHQTVGRLIDHIVQTWPQAAHVRLNNYIQAKTNSRYHDPATLARTIFACTKCKNQVLYFPEVLSHPCLMLRYKPGPSERSGLEEIIETLELDDSPWDPARSLIISDFTRLADSIITQCGMDPQRITTVELASLDLTVVCSRPCRGQGRGWVHRGPDSLRNVVRHS